MLGRYFDCSSFVDMLIILQLLFYYVKEQLTISLDVCSRGSRFSLMKYASSFAFAFDSSNFLWYCSRKLEDLMLGLDL